MKSLFIRIIFVLLPLSLSSCGQLKPAQNESLQSSKCMDCGWLPPSGLVAVSSSANSITSELSDSKNVTLALSSAGYVGNVDIEIATPEIDVLDKRDGLVFSASPAVIAVPAAGMVNVQINVDILSKAPTVSNEHIHVLIYEAGTENLLGEVEIKLNVLPIFRIQVRGAGDANWSVNGSAINTLFNSATVSRGIEFVHHAAGVSVIFENYATAPMSIHSSGAIAHQVGSMTASPDGIAKGGTYNPPAVVGATPVSGYPYLHNGEGSGNVRQLMFNTDL